MEACLVVRRWAVLRAKEELDALMAALDRRGLREGALHSALEKVSSADTPLLALCDWP